MHVSVIIPVYNALDYARECVASIFAAGGTLDFEVIVVDNGSSGDVLAWLEEEERRHPRLRHLRYPEPLGFAKAVNAGAAVAFGQVLILLNSDAVVSTGWMEGLHAALVAQPLLGVVSPLTNHAGDLRQIDLRTRELTPAQALKLSAQQPNPYELVRVSQRVTFFCAAVRRAVWDELGGLDEAYGTGNFEDDQFCLRLQVAGYQLAIARHVFVYHHSNRSFRHNRISHEQWMQKNEALFAAQARVIAETRSAPARRARKSSGADISVIIQPGAGPLERTLISLDNQTLGDFEVILPDSGALPGRDWIAYVTAGDILYPFHLEVLREALEQGQADAVFSDGWIAGATRSQPHLDLVRLSEDAAALRRNPAPRMRAGWMHHSSLTTGTIFGHTVPLHWPKVTWEMQRPPAESELAGEQEPTLQQRAIEVVRGVYRNTVSYGTRITIDRNIQKLFGVSLGSQPALSRQGPLRQLAADLSDRAAAGTDASTFGSPTAKPAIFLFNIIPWDALYQRPHHFAHGLAQRGHRVFWIETHFRGPHRWWSGAPLPEVSPGVHRVVLPGPLDDVYQLHWTQAAQDAMFAALRHIASAYGVGEAVSIVHFPRWRPLVARLRDELNWKILYDCLDDQSAFANLYQTTLADHEERLIETADRITTSSTVLQKRFQGTRDLLLLPNGADFELFSSGAGNTPLARLRPLIGFFGALADWLDLDLIQATAQRFPNWSFVFIGSTSFSTGQMQERWRQATRAPNITVLPQMPPSALADHLADFDVCTMPFLDIPVTRTMNAVKLYEYLAAGKPVVSRDLPEVRHMFEDALRDDPAGDGTLIRLYSSPEQFFAQLEAALKDRSDFQPRYRREFARQHDWSSRVDVLSRVILDLAPAPVHEANSINARSNGSNTLSQQ